MSIVDFDTGGRYALAALKQVINAAWEKAELNQANYGTKIANATAGFLDVTSPPTMAASTVSPMPSVTEPAVDIPASVEASTVYTDFDEKYIEIIDELATRYSSFISTYFPSDAANFALVESWLSDEINNPDRVLPATLVDTITEDARANISAESVRLQDEVAALWASKGYPIPPGAAVGATTAISLKEQGELAKVERETAIKTFELAYDKVKFAISNAIETRKMGLAASVSYIQALASGPDVASRIVNVGYDSQSRLISAAAQFYNARTAVSELTLKAQSFNAQQEQGAAAENLKSELVLIEDKLKALLAEAQALAQNSTALFNNINASTSSSYGDSIQQNLNF